MVFSVLEKIVQPLFRQQVTKASNVIVRRNQEDVKYMALLWHAPPAHVQSLFYARQQFRKLAGRDAGGAGKVAEIVAGGPHSDV